LQFIPGQEIDVEVAQIQIGTLNGKVRNHTENGQIQVLVPLDAGETERLLSLC